QSNGWSRIVAEDEERRAKGPQFRQRQAIDDGRHRVFADAEMEISPTRRAGLEIPGPLKRQSGFVGRAEIGRSAQQPGDVLGEYVQYFPCGIAPRGAFRIGCVD